MQSQNKGKSTFPIVLITDLDKNSKTVNEDGDTVWKSRLMKGNVTYDHNGQEVSIEVQGKAASELYSEYSRGGRGMELSELAIFNEKLYTVDDRTGIVYNIDNGKAIPWAILADGDGKQAKGFKGEWITTKDGNMYIGGHGREFISDDGERIVHRNYQWVKVLDKNGAVTHENWEEIYDQIRAAAGCPFPGYLIHESGEWSEKHKQWFFLPRKVSTEPYHEKLDENRAGNILIRCSEDFKDIKITEIGELKNKTRGFSTFKFIPGTEDQVIVAVKSEEVDNAQKSYFTAFTVDGKILLPDKEFSSGMKYEGLEFI